MRSVDGLLAIPALYAVWNVYSALRARRAVWPLPAAPAHGAWPKVSLIVPACNEAGSVEAATKAKLASDYPELEIILVDDRSTDGTSEIVDRLAAADPRVKVVHITELPDGWLGKVNALHRGTQEATGEWLLYSDADVFMSPSLLRRAIAAAEERGLDQVGMIPHMRSAGAVLDVVLGCFVRLFFVAGRFWEVPDPHSRVALGNGMFNLARRSMFERTAGYPWLKLEILDDQVFAQMMKRAGARCGIFDSDGDLVITMYPTLGELMRGLEKNGYVLMGQLRIHRLFLALFFFLYVEVGAAFLLPSPGAASVLLAIALVQVYLARWGKRPILRSLVPIVGPLALAVFVLRSALLAHARGGIRWRGTTYPLADLRRGQRLELL